MSNQVKIKVGQIWTHPGFPEWEYYITDIRPSPDNKHIMRVYARFVRLGQPFMEESYFGSCQPDGAPEWIMDGWTYIHGKLFSRISAKTLRKRVRDQWAAASLKPIA